MVLLVVMTFAAVPAAIFQVSGVFERDEDDNTRSLLLYYYKLFETFSFRSLSLLQVSEGRVHDIPLVR
jgi:hypothetical protein